MKPLLSGRLTNDVSDGNQSQSVFNPLLYLFTGSKSSRKHLKIRPYFHPKKKKEREKKKRQNVQKRFLSFKDPKNLPVFFNENAIHRHAFQNTK